jgi:hypothetical protein
MAYTLGQAAKAVGRNKATLSAAIKKGRISASKGENGAFQIEEEELFRVYPQNEAADGGQTADKQPDRHSENSALEARLQVLEELVGELRADKARAAVREDELRRDIERWQVLTFEARDRLKALEAPKPECQSKIIEAETAKWDSASNAEVQTSTKKGWFSRIRKAFTLGEGKAVA